MTAAASVSYAALPGSGALWVANFNGHSVGAYTAAQLTASTAAAPATAVGTGASSIAFDPNGNLWVSNVGFEVVEFTASQLAASGRPTPAVTLTANGSGSLDNPEGLAFDGNGNLWIADRDNSTVVQFTASQLAATGSPTPAVTLNDDGSGSLAGLVGLAFDGSGNLWLTNNRDSMVVEFTTSQLVSSGSPTPNVILSASGGSLNSPEGLAFDASGNLWVSNTSNTGTGTVVESTASQLATSGTPTPNVTVSGSSISEPVGLAFDPAATTLPLTGGADRAGPRATGISIRRRSPPPTR